jgi:hypothetical protein
MVATLVCQKCGAPDEVTIVLDGREISAEEYENLAEMARMAIPCEDCGSARRTLSGRVTKLRRWDGPRVSDPRPRFDSDGGLGHIEGNST